MSIVLPTLAASFAALCIWLTVRIVNRQERWAKWTLAVVVGLPVLHALSFGPACPRQQVGNSTQVTKAVAATARSGRCGSAYRRPMGQ